MDIEQRLREVHPNSQQYAGGSNILLEAADEIAKLKRQLATMTITRDSLVLDLKQDAKTIAELRAKKLRLFGGEECWIYDEDGDNHLDSLVCPVVISAKKLIELGG